MNKLALFGRQESPFSKRESEAHTSFGQNDINIKLMHTQVSDPRFH